MVYLLTWQKAWKVQRWTLVVGHMRLAALANPEPPSLTTTPGGAMRASRADQAREFLRHDNPCRNASLADTEAVTLHRLLNAWRADAGVPSLDQVDELLQWFRRSRPVSRQACDLLRDWEAA